MAKISGYGNAQKASWKIPGSKCVVFDYLCGEFSVPNTDFPQEPFLEIIVNNLMIPLEKDGPEEYLRAAGRKLGVDASLLSFGRFLSKALDLRDQSQLYFKVSLTVSADDGILNQRDIQLYVPSDFPDPPQGAPAVRPIIVGFGPAGMFAALEFLERGIRPIVFERGKEIGARLADVRQFIAEGRLNPESNVQFGEGGAGSFSDGKLFSRRNNNSSHTNRVLQTFVRFGAPADILYNAKPHLGTDVLCSIVRKIRLHILDRGGEIHYNSRMTDLIISAKKVQGIVVNGDREFLAPHIFLALGHSARETLKMMLKRGVAMQQKPLSVGVRIEHPAETINLMRYGEKYQNHPALSAATYSLNYTDRKIGRGAYTFCMCPGGEIVNASSSEGMLVTNGMSYSQRSSSYSNAALIVSCHTDDYASDDPLAGVNFQQQIESRAFAAGGGQWKAPAQNLLHFLGVEGPGELPASSFKMGIVQADLKDLFPPFVGRQLLEAFKKWQQQVPLFVSGQAVLVAPETRTTSPVKISRNSAYESVNIQNLHLIGEGSGYTGGITSSAVDAVKAVEAYVNKV